MLSSSAAGRVDEAIAAELLRAVAPMAIEAAAEAERRHMQSRLSNNVSWSWNCSRRDTKLPLPNGVMPRAIPTIA